MDSNSSTDEKCQDSAPNPRMLAARLRVSHPVEPEVLAHALETQARELDQFKRLQASLVTKIKNLHSRGMIDGHSVVRREDAIKAVAYGAEDD